MGKLSGNNKVVVLLREKLFLPNKLTFNASHWPAVNTFFYNLTQAWNGLGINLHRRITWCHSQHCKVKQTGYMLTDVSLYSFIFKLLCNGRRRMLKRIVCTRRTKGRRMCIAVKPLCEATAANSVLKAVWMQNWSQKWWDCDMASVNQISSKISGWQSWQLVSSAHNYDKCGSKGVALKKIWSVCTKNHTQKRPKSDSSDLCCCISTHC